MPQPVSPDELSRRCGVDGKRMRAWLRDRWREGHPLLTDHVHGQPWEITTNAAARLAAEFTAGHAQRPSRVRAPRAGRSAEHGREPEEWPRSEEPGHRVTEDWMGEPTETLADLLRPGLRGALVGWNPTPRSVAAGHYYQGRAGRVIIGRLRRAGLIPDGDGHQDDLLYADGIGFTDLVKRPTAKRDQLTDEEIERGARELERRIAEHQVPLVIVTFAGAAKPLLGFTPTCGLVEGVQVAGAGVFAMPGRRDRREAAMEAMHQLAQLLGGSAEHGNDGGGAPRTVRTVRPVRL